MPRDTVLAWHLTSGAGFSSEAMPKAGHLDGQLLLFHNLVHEHGAQWDLCSACQAQRGVLHAVYLHTHVSHLQACLPTECGADGQKLCKCAKAKANSKQT